MLLVTKTTISKEKFPNLLMLLMTLESNKMLFKLKLITSVKPLLDSEILCMDLKNKLLLLTKLLLNNKEPSKKEMLKLLTYLLLYHKLKADALNSTKLMPIFQLNLTMLHINLLK